MVVPKDDKVFIKYKEFVHLFDIDLLKFYTDYDPEYKGYILTKDIKDYFK
jgi:hypothetical protein